MRKFTFIGIFWLCCVMAATALASPAPQDFTAQSVILIEATTGKVLYEKAAEKRQYPASTTKMATLLVALENANLEDTVSVSANAAATEGSSLELKAGDRLKIKDLLYGIMLVSANDATVALAEHMEGSVSAFAQKMTEKAHAIGAVETNFVNSSGLPDERHYTTAHDLARIAQYGLKNALFREIAGTKEREIWWVGQSRSELLENTNELLGEYPGCIGIKTGYTQAAGDCLVSAAERNGVTLICVVLHSDERWEETKQLFDYGFEQVKLEKAYAKEDLLRDMRVHFSDRFNVPVMPVRDIEYPVSGADRSLFSIQLDLPPFMQAPLKQGDQIGFVRVLYRGQEIERVPMVTATPAEEGFSFLSLITVLYDYIFDALGVKTRE